MKMKIFILTIALTIASTVFCQQYQSPGLSLGGNSFKQSSIDLSNYEKSNKQTCTELPNNDSLWEECKDMYGKRSLQSGGPLKAKADYCQNTAGPLGLTLAQLEERCNIIAQVITYYNGDQELRDNTMIMDQQSGYTMSCDWNEGIAVDYGSCVNFVNLFRAQMITDEGIKIEQEVEKIALENKASAKMSEASKDMANSQGTYIDVAKDHAKKGKEQANVRAVYQGTKFATFGSLMIAYTGPKKVQKKCYSSDIAGSANEELCKEIFDDQELTRQMFRNQEARMMLAKLTTESGVKSGAEIFIASQYKKQINRLSGIKDQLDEADKESKSGLVQQDIMMTECQYNPNLPQCRGLGINHQAGGSYGNMNFGGSGVTQYTDAGKSGDLDLSPDNTASVKPSELEPGLGSDLVNFDSQSGAHMIDTNGGPATVRYGPQSGGGGGGGGSASGGGIPGSASKTSNPNDEKATPINLTTSGINYAGGGKMKSSYGAISNKGSKESSEDNNPFSKFFNKDKANKTGDTLNFRNVASDQFGKQKDDIFARISSRYDKIKNSDRLLKYEEDKK